MQIRVRSAKYDRAGKMTGEVGRTIDQNDLRPTYDHDPDDPWSGAKCHELLEGDDLNLFFAPGPEDRPEGMSHLEWSSEMRMMGAERDLTAKVRYCDGCPVRAECLEIGMYEPHGVFGGTTPSERDAMLRGTYVVLPAPGGRGPLFRRERVVALVKEGYSFDDVTDETGVSRRQVQDHLNAYLRSRNAK